jgi:hypothetical protein
MPILKHLAIRKEMPVLPALANSLMVRKNIKLTTAAMLTVTVKPMAVILVTVVMVLVVAVIINFSSSPDIG